MQIVTRALQFFRESDPVNPVDFDLNWTGVHDTRLVTTDTSYPVGDPRRKPYDGQWVTLGVTLPITYTDDYWRLKYTIAGCGGDQHRSPYLASLLSRWRGDPDRHPAALAERHAVAYPYCDVQRHTHRAADEYTHQHRDEYTEARYPDGHGNYIAADQHAHPHQPAEHHAHPHADRHPQPPPPAATTAGASLRS